MHPTLQHNRPVGLGSRQGDTRYYAEGRCIRVFGLGLPSRAYCTVVGGSTAGGGASGLDSSCGDGGDRNGDTADEIDETSQDFVLG